MKAEIMMIGTELLLGQIQDTNATYMAQRLAENGIDLYQKTTVGDNQARIVAALTAALDRSDVVICSGGLGPTEDDITRECVAEALDRPLEYHEDLYETIFARFAHLRLSITENNRKQAMLPRGAQAIPNPNGTAPGVLVEDDRGVILCLPGVPWELKAMFEHDVLPYLRQRYGLSGVLHYRVLKVCGLGESRVDALIGDLITSLDNPTIGLLASPDSVRIRIAAKAQSVAAAEALIDPVDAELRNRLPGLIMGRDADTLEGVVDRLLRERGWTLAVAETQSGGMLCQRLTLAGAASFVGGKVVPLNRLEGVDPAGQALDTANALLIDFPDACALALVADPEKGHTAVAFLTPEGSASWEVGFYGTGERNQIRTSVVTLEYVRRYLTGKFDAH